MEQYLFKFTIKKVGGGLEVGYIVAPSLGEAATKYEDFVGQGLESIEYVGDTVFVFRSDDE